MYGASEGTCIEKLSRAHEMLSRGNKIASRYRDAICSNEVLSCAREINFFVYNV